MHAAIYARTCSEEKRHHTTSIANQVAYCRELAAEHNLFVDEGYIFTDIEARGSAHPSCWAEDDDQTRPALSSMIETIESREISHVIVHRIQKLATSHDLLTALLRLFQEHGVTILARPEALEDPGDPSARFAASILQPSIQTDSEADKDKKAQLRATKLEELSRLKNKIDRLEAEIAELG